MPRRIGLRHRRNRDRCPVPWWRTTVLAREIGTLGSPCSTQRTGARRRSLIGFHEAGHVVIWEYGLRQTQRWFDEMLATFVAYAFLSDRHADEARVWNALMQRHIKSLRPDFRDLDIFNARVDE